MMAELFPTVAALVAFEVLILSSVNHLRAPARFRRVLLQQAIWPRWSLWPLAFLVAIVEFGLGLFGLLYVLQRALSTGEFILALTGVLYFAYAMYALYLWRWLPHVPCGCTGDEETVNGWVPARAASLALCALFAFLFPDRLIGAGLNSDFLIAAAAGLALTIVLWALPSAMQIPTGYPPTAQEARRFRR